MRAENLKQEVAWPITKFKLLIIMINNQFFQKNKLSYGFVHKKLSLDVCNIRWNFVANNIFVVRNIILLDFMATHVLKEIMQNNTQYSNSSKYPNHQILGQKLALI